MATLRYAVLHHTGHGEPHYDLLVEREPGGPLRAWRLAAWPVEGEVAAIALPDHRRLYLDYEGPVSGGRGAVVRVASGEASVEGKVVTLRDGTVTRTLTLR